MAVSDILVLLRNDIEKSIPGNSSFKIKVTAIDICGPYIVLGSNAGTLYLFNNETSSFIQKIQTTKGRITQISISPDIAFLACSSSSGLVFILKIPNFVPQSNLHPVSSRKHEGSIVTALSWSNNGRDLYIGDGDGILSLLHVPPNLASSLYLKPYTLPYENGFCHLSN
ncbi:Hermansky-Pudlak syndrome 5 protein-like [Armadillidium vulgare]|nr:Hermansky-Pudlak syndrome 5 protein-like [Armadillidium vulgare]